MFGGNGYCGGWPVGGMMPYSDEEYARQIEQSKKNEVREKQLIEARNKAAQELTTNLLQEIKEELLIFCKSQNITESLDVAIEALVLDSGGKTVLNLLQALNTFDLAYNKVQLPDCMRDFIINNHSLISKTSARKAEIEQRDDCALLNPHVRFLFRDKQPLCNKLAIQVVEQQEVEERKPQILVKPSP